MRVAQSGAVAFVVVVVAELVASDPFRKLVHSADYLLVELLRQEHLVNCLRFPRPADSAGRLEDLTWLIKLVRQVKVSWCEVWNIRLEHIWHVEVRDIALLLGRLLVFKGFPDDVEG